MPDRSRRGTRRRSSGRGCPGSRGRRPRSAGAWGLLSQRRGRRSTGQSRRDGTRGSVIGKVWYRRRRARRRRRRFVRRASRARMAARCVPSSGGPRRFDRRAKASAPHQAPALDHLPSLPYLHCQAGAHSSPGRAVGDGGGLDPGGDAELGQDVGDVDAGRLGLMNNASAIWRLLCGRPRPAPGPRPHAG